MRGSFAQPRSILSWKLSGASQEEDRNQRLSLQEARDYRTPAEVVPRVEVRTGPLFAIEIIWVVHVCKIRAIGWRKSSCFPQYAVNDLLATTYDGPSARAGGPAWAREYGIHATNMAEAPYKRILNRCRTGLAGQQKRLPCGRVNLGTICFSYYFRLRGVGISGIME